MAVWINYLLFYFCNLVLFQYLQITSHFDKIHIDIHEILHGTL